LRAVFKVTPQQLSPQGSEFQKPPDCECRHFEIRVLQCTRRKADLFQKGERTERTSAGDVREIREACAADEASHRSDKWSSKASPIPKW
jgi:hypothetical protein